MCVSRGLQLVPAELGLDTAGQTKGAPELLLLTVILCAQPAPAASREPAWRCPSSWHLAINLKSYLNVQSHSCVVFVEANHIVERTFKRQ